MCYGNTEEEYYGSTEEECYGSTKKGGMGVLKRSAMGLPSLVLRHQVLHVELVRVLALALQCSAHKLEPIAYSPIGAAAAAHA